MTLQGVKKLKVLDIYPGVESSRHRYRYQASIRGREGSVPGLRFEVSGEV